MRLASCSLEVAHGFLLLESPNSPGANLERHGGGRGRLDPGGGWRRGGVSAYEGEEKMGRGRRRERGDLDWGRPMALK